MHKYLIFNINQTYNKYFSSGMYKTLSSALNNINV